MQNFSELSSPGSAEPVIGAGGTTCTTETTGAKTAKITIYHRFQDALPLLSETEKADLERSIVKNGCRDPLVLYKGRLVDGHNRFEICTARGIAYNTVEMDFKDDLEAKTWILENQLSRRNITNAMRKELIGKLRKAGKKSRGGDRKSEKSKCHDDTLIDKIIAKKHNVSKSAGVRAEKFADGLARIAQIDSTVANKIRHEQTRIPDNAVEKLVGAPNEDVRRIVDAVLGDTAIAALPKDNDLNDTKIKRLISAVEKSLGKISEFYKSTGKSRACDHFSAIASSLAGWQNYVNGDAPESEVVEESDEGIAGDGGVLRGECRRQLIELKNLKFKAFKEFQQRWGTIEQVLDKDLPAALENINVLIREAENE